MELLEECLSIFRSTKERKNNIKKRNNETHFAYMRGDCVGREKNHFEISGMKIIIETNKKNQHLV